jgi:hypothetical protein
MHDGVPQAKTYDVTRSRKVKRFLRGRHDRGRSC